ncbi:hypothetical protein FJZ41_02790 [Candidatus Shapirobacteria bacterium]|nr:hypothetical protein [Candidatus Shapirobacteria bacterium]
MKKKNISIDQLAQMVQRGFNETAVNMDRRFEHVDKRFDAVDKRLDKLEQGHEEIKLRLDNVAYRFELVELQRRVEILEKKTGIKK